MAKRNPSRLRNNIAVMINSNCTLVPNVIGVWNVRIQYCVPMNDIERMTMVVRVPMIINCWGVAFTLLLFVDDDDDDLVSSGVSSLVGPVEAMVSLIAAN